MRRKNILRFASLVSFIFLLLNGQIVFSMEPSLAILGDVVGKGSAEMKTAFGKWISISDKAYPMIEGADLRSGEGSMSAIFRDGARMEIGKNAELTVSGSKGNYSVDLRKGKMGFSVPKGVGFSITTPTSAVQTELTPNMIQKVSTGSEEYVRGIVGYDGRGTTVTSVSGTLMVKDSKGAGVQTVTAGNSIYAAGADSGYRPSRAQLADPNARGAQGGGNPNPPPAKDTGDPTLSPLIPLGGGALLGGTYLYVNSESKARGVASPHAP